MTSYNTFTIFGRKSDKKKYETNKKYWRSLTN